MPSAGVTLSVKLYDYMHVTLSDIHLLPLHLHNTGNAKLFSSVCTFRQHLGTEFHSATHLSKLVLGIFKHDTLVNDTVVNDPTATTGQIGLAGCIRRGKKQKPVHSKDPIREHGHSLFSGC